MKQKTSTVDYLRLITKRSIYYFNFEKKAIITSSLVNHDLVIIILSRTIQFSKPSRLSSSLLETLIQQHNRDKISKNWQYKTTVKKIRCSIKSKKKN